MAVSTSLLARALEKIPDKRMLINGLSKRAAELARGGRPLISVNPQDGLSHLDIAMKEVIEGKISVTRVEVTED
jgi:DNA-directed RNA polymerase subunit K/omega